MIIINVKKYYEFKKMPQKKINNMMAPKEFMELTQIRDVAAELQAEDFILILIRFKFCFVSE